MKNKNYRSISEVAELLKIEKHVIRYWDSKFEGISTRLGERKRRFFSPKNIKRLQTLIKLLHTDGKSHHSLVMARKIIEGNFIEKNIKIPNEQIPKKTNMTELIKISENLKKIIK